MYAYIQIIAQKWKKVQKIMLSFLRFMYYLSQCFHRTIHLEYEHFKHTDNNNAAPEETANLLYRYFQDFFEVFSPQTRLRQTPLRINSNLESVRIMRTNEMRLSVTESLIFCYVIASAFAVTICSS